MAIFFCFCIEIYFSFQFYSNEPEFPSGIFTIEVLNAAFRDLLLAGMLLLFQKHFVQVKQIAKNYSPIFITAGLWIVISAMIIHSLRLNFDTLTALSILAGVINNSVFLLLAAYIYSRQKTLLWKTLYFGVYFFTLFFFYSDTAYFLVTSAHIERIIFENLNPYSIIGVLSSTDKPVLIGIFVSFFLFLFLFRTPKNPNLQINTNYIGITFTIMLYISVNLINVATAYVYPKALTANGFNAEGEIETARNVSRDMLSESVTFNLLREFLRSTELQTAVASQSQRVEFSAEEINLLKDLGIDIDAKAALQQKAAPYERIIVIVAESFHRDYLHYYNPRIPAEASQFLDGLLAEYPHADHYYTSHKPTTQGLNAMFLSQIFYSSDQSFEDNVTVFKTLENNDYDTVFLEATSQYYNDEFRAYKKRFGMHHYIAKEDIEKQGYTGSSGWGFHNDVMYDETLKILEQNRNNKIFIVTKTIDSHQPYPYCGFTYEDIPWSINYQNNIYLKAIYWENMCLEKFFRQLKEKNLLDDKTLVIVTSDHNPHPSQDGNYKRLGEDDLRLTVAPIPLIFVSKNLQPFENWNRTSYASQIDFAPTLLGILGIPIPPEFSGRNMLHVPEDTSYAIGYFGDMIYFWSKNKQMAIDTANEKSETDSEKALVHWVEDSYAKYFQNKTAASLQ